MQVASTSTLFDLPSGKRKLDHLFLHGSGLEIFRNLEQTANESFQLLARLQAREDVDQNEVFERAAPLNDLLSNSRVLRDNLLSVDGRLERAARESAIIQGRRQLQEQLYAAEKSGDVVSAEQLRSELRARQQRVRAEQYRMLPDMKASLRYRLLLLRRWRAMLNIEIGLYDILVKALSRSIERLRAGLGGDRAAWQARPIPPDDAVPERANEIRSLIISEARDLEETLKKKEMLQRLLEALDETERFVSTELDNQVRSFAVAPPVPPEEERPETRIIYRTDN